MAMLTMSPLAMGLLLLVLAVVTMAPASAIGLGDREDRFDDDYYDSRGKSFVCIHCTCC